jgi:hypothetical protein
MKHIEFLKKCQNHWTLLSKLRNLTPPQLASAQWFLFRLWQLENEEIEAFCLHHCAIAIAMPIRQSLRTLQRCEAFIAAFTNEKLKMTIKKILRNWLLILNLIICQSLYDKKPNAQSKRCA